MIEEHPTFSHIYSYAALYVISGCSQPLLMTLCKNAGLADPKCQLYMVFYYLGPSFVMLKLILISHDVTWPSMENKIVIVKACCIALWDICSATLNYTGASLAGPTIFSIVYSSVTIWTALFSYVFLHRTMNIWQWIGVLTVFGGLTITASDAASASGTSNDNNNNNNDVMVGFLLVLFGSAMHALTYVLSERIMISKISGEPVLSMYQNCAIQSSVALVSLIVWQVVYTIPNFDTLIRQPAQDAGTTLSYGVTIMISFAIANLIHSIGFFHTIKYFIGGATSAGVMKGLQAVLVFILTHLLYCGKTGGNEMCLSHTKIFSLITVIGGCIFYVIMSTSTITTSTGTTSSFHQQSQSQYGYEKIQDIEAENILTGSVEIEQLV